MHSCGLLELSVLRALLLYFSCFFVGVASTRLFILQINLINTTDSVSNNLIGVARLMMNEFINL